MNDRWIKYPSKTFPDKHYYFNPYSGLAVWDLNDVMPLSTTNQLNRPHRPHTPHESFPNMNGFFPNNIPHQNGFPSFTPFWVNHPVCMMPVPVLVPQKENTSNFFVQTTSVPLSNRFKNFTVTKDLGKLKNNNANNLASTETRKSCHIDVHVQKNHDIDLRSQLSEQLISTDFGIKVKDNKSINLRDAPQPRESISIQSIIESPKPVVNNIFKDDHINDMLQIDVTCFKKWAKPFMRKDMWFIVVDMDILLDRIEYIEKLVKSDPDCRLMVPYAIICEVNNISSMSHRQVRVRSARKVNRFLAREMATRKTVIGQTAYEATENPSRCLSDAILQCCKQLLGQNYFVIIISNDAQLRKKSLNFGVHSLSMSDVEKYVDKQQYFEPSQKFTKCDERIKMSTIKVNDYLRKQENIAKSFRHKSTNIINGFTKEIDNNRNSVHVIHNNNYLDTNLNEIQVQNGRKRQKSIHDNTGIDNKLLKLDTKNKASNSGFHEKHSAEVDVNLNGITFDLSFRSMVEKYNGREDKGVKIKNRQTIDKVDRNDDSSKRTQKDNTCRSIQKNHNKSSPKLTKGITKKDKAMKCYLKSNINQLANRLSQIMIDALMDILKEKHRRLHLTPPLVRRLPNLTDAIKVHFRKHELVKEAADKLSSYFQCCTNEDGKIRENLKPNRFIKLVLRSCSLLLLLKEIEAKQNLEMSLKLLKQILNEIQNPTTVTNQISIDQNVSANDCNLKIIQNKSKSDISEPNNVSSTDNNKIQPTIIRTLGNDVKSVMFNKDKTIVLKNRNLKITKLKDPSGFVKNFKSVKLTDSKNIIVTVSKIDSDKTKEQKESTYSKNDNTTNKLTIDSLDSKVNKDKSVGAEEKYERKELMDLDILNYSPMSLEMTENDVFFEDQYVHNDINVNEYDQDIVEVSKENNRESIASKNGTTKHVTLNDSLATNVNDIEKLNDFVHNKKILNLELNLAERNINTIDKNDVDNEVQCVKNVSDGKNVDKDEESNKSTIEGNAHVTVVTNRIDRGFFSPDDNQNFNSNILETKVEDDMIDIKVKKSSSNYITSNINGIHPDSTQSIVESSDTAENILSEPIVNVKYNIESTQTNIEILKLNDENDLISINSDINEVAVSASDMKQHKFEVTQENSSASLLDRDESIMIKELEKCDKDNCKTTKDDILLPVGNGKYNIDLTQTNIEILKLNNENDLTSMNSDIKEVAVSATDIKQRKFEVAQENSFTSLFDRDESIMIRDLEKCDKDNCKTTKDDTLLPVGSIKYTESTQTNIEILKLNDEKDLTRINSDINEVAVSVPDMKQHKFEVTQENSSTSLFDRGESVMIKELEKCDKDNCKTTKYDMLLPVGNGEYNIESTQTNVETLKLNKQNDLTNIDSAIDDIAVSATDIKQHIFEVTQENSSTSLFDRDKSIMINDLEKCDKDNCKTTKDDTSVKYNTESTQRNIEILNLNKQNDSTHIYSDIDDIAVSATDVNQHKFEVTQENSSTSLFDRDESIVIKYLENCDNDNCKTTMDETLPSDLTLNTKREDSLTNYLDKTQIKSNSVINDVKLNETEMYVSHDVDLKKLLLMGNNSHENDNDITKTRKTENDIKINNAVEHLQFQIDKYICFNPDNTVNQKHIVKDRKNEFMETSFDDVDESITSANITNFTNSLLTNHNNSFDDHCESYAKENLDYTDNAIEDLNLKNYNVELEVNEECNFEKNVMSGLINIETPLKLRDVELQNHTINEEYIVPLKYDQDKLEYENVETYQHFASTKNYESAKIVEENVRNNIDAVIQGLENVLELDVIEIKDTVTNDDKMYTTIPNYNFDNEQNSYKQYEISHAKTNVDKFFLTPFEKTKSLEFENDTINGSCFNNDTNKIKTCIQDFETNMSNADISDIRNMKDMKLEENFVTIDYDDKNIQSSKDNNTKQTCVNNSYCFEEKEEVKNVQGKTVGGNADYCVDHLEDHNAMECGDPEERISKTTIKALKENINRYNEETSSQTESEVADVTSNKTGDQDYKVDGAEIKNKMNIKVFLKEVDHALTAVREYLDKEHVMSSVLAKISERVLIETKTCNLMKLLKCITESESTDVSNNLSVFFEGAGLTERDINKVDLQQHRYIIKKYLDQAEVLYETLNTALN